MTCFPSYCPSYLSTTTTCTAAYCCCRKHIATTKAVQALFVHCATVVVSTLCLPTPPSVYANVDVIANKSTSISKTMFATHVDEMHCNRGEGFEIEFKVSVCLCVCVSVCTSVCMRVCVHVRQAGEQYTYIIHVELTLIQCSVLYCFG